MKWKHRRLLRSNKMSSRVLSLSGATMQLRPRLNHARIGGPLAQQITAVNSFHGKALQILYSGRGWIVYESGVVPANQTEESEVCELSRRESGIGSRTCFLRGLCACTVFARKRGFRNQFCTPSPKVHEPHLLCFGLPEPPS